MRTSEFFITQDEEFRRLNQLENELFIYLTIHRVIFMRFYGKQAIKFLV